MKNSTFFYWLISALIFVSTAESQAQYHVGIRAGVNFANFKPGEIFDYDTRVGTNVAVLFNKNLNARLSIQFEPGFSQRGAQYETSGEGPLNGLILKSEETGKFLLNLIELPVLLQWKSSIGKFTGIVSLGPELRYRVGNVRFKYTSKITYDGVVSKDESGVVNMNDGFGQRAFDYGVAGGLGIAYPVKSLKIFAEARYHLGLRRLIGDLKMYNRGPSAHLGVLVPMGK
ncbi:porin family protein [Dyadobacter sp. 676]|uniref:Porin family protein n=1 Tax=Dyadobacter sp. 676 TaxID=3088362 RepID=A0AAU8FR41_9BACT